ncbi:WAT1-related protein At1g44800-like [Carex rostrata]
MYANSRICFCFITRPVMDQNMFFFGMRSTSASMTSIMSNLLPAITFLLALILRIERVNLSEGSSKLKILGTVISVAGAVSMPIYKGRCLVRGKSVGHVYHRGAANKNSISGFFLLFGSFSSWSSYMIFQAMVLRDYPFELTVAGLTCLSGTVLGIAAEIILEHDIAAWKLHVGWKLYTIIYAGIVVSGMSFCIQGYVTKEKGPVFVTAFSPLSMIVVSIFGLFFLEEDLLVGRLIGAIVITLGLYMVIWGKRGDNRCRVLPQEPQPQDVVLPQIPIVLPKQNIVLSPHNHNGSLANIYNFVSHQEH